MRTLSERLWARIDVRSDGECWLWIGAAVKGKYGTLGRGGRGQGNVLAHVAVYEELVGEVPDGWQVDHTCRVTLCCNPRHLEAVTQAENLRRQAAAKTHCNRGHRYTPENTYHPPARPTWRQCRACIKIRAAIDAARRRARRSAA